MDRRADALPLPDADRRRIDFLLHAHLLTRVDRVNRLLDGSRAETSAEHSWHLALCAIVLARDAAPDVDLGRVLELLVVHDVVEVDVGDVPIYDVAAREAAEALEEAAAQRLFGALPPADGAYLLARFHEFVGGESDEARFARALDRLQPMLLHWALGSSGPPEAHPWRLRGVTVAQEQAFVDRIADQWPALRPHAAAVLADARARGMLVEP